VGGDHKDGQDDCHNHNSSGEAPRAICALQFRLQQGDAFLKRHGTCPPSVIRPDDMVPQFGARFHSFAGDPRGVVHAVTSDLP